MKFLTVCLVLGFIQAGHAAEPGSRNVMDEIIEDYRLAQSFPDFLKRSNKAVLPGDTRFIQNKLARSTELKNLKKMPALAFENGMFTIRSGKNTVTMRFSDKEKFEFEVNKQKIILHPAMVPSIRWLRINDALVQNRTSWISFMPVAYAQEHGEPTYTNLMIFNLTSRLSRDATTAFNIKTENKKVNYPLIWKKAKEMRSSCGSSYFRDLGKWMAELQVTTLLCEQENIKGKNKYNGNIIFELPFGENSFRQVKVNRKMSRVEEISPELEGKILTYKKVGKKEKFWQPVEKFEEEYKERGYQMNRLVDYAMSSNFCGRCAQFMKTASVEILNEIDIDPTQVLGSDNSAPQTPSQAPPTGTMGVPDKPVPSSSQGTPHPPSL